MKISVIKINTTNVHERILMLLSAADSHVLAMARKTKSYHRYVTFSRHILFLTSHRLHLNFGQLKSKQ